MIIAKFFYKDSKPCGFEIKGHAGYGYEGNDIVCAGVSSVVEYVCNTITDCFNIEAEVDVNDDKIQLKLPYSDEISEKMLDGLLMHLKFISEDFEGTIKITTLEV